MNALATNQTKTGEPLRARRKSPRLWRAILPARVLGFGNVGEEEGAYHTEEERQEEDDLVAKMGKRKEPGPSTNEQACKGTNDEGRNSHYPIAARKIPASHSGGNKVGSQRGPSGVAEIAHEGPDCAHADDDPNCDDRAIREEGEYDKEN